MFKNKHHQIVLYDNIYNYYLTTKTLFQTHLEYKHTDAEKHPYSTGAFAERHLQQLQTKKKPADTIF